MCWASTPQNSSQSEKEKYAMDINHATAEQLEQAFEVDGERAHYIINKRNELGGFSSWEQIKQVVPSIEDHIVENLRRAGLTIGPEGGGRQHTVGQQHEATSSTKQSQTGTHSEDTGGMRDVNTASREELEQLCQIDGERANYFLQKRNELGGFTSWEQIKDTVRSFDGGMIKRMKKAGFGLRDRKVA
jgi:DNA uptake protein ComE-like DNA-binding protein